MSSAIVPTHRFKGVFSADSSGCLDVRLERDKLRTRRMEREERAREGWTKLPHRTTDITASGVSLVLCDATIHRCKGHYPGVYALSHSVNIAHSISAGYATARQ